MPDKIEGLSDLTLAILDIATREDALNHSGEDGGSSPHTVTEPAGSIRRRTFRFPPVGPVFTPGVH